MATSEHTRLQKLRQLPPGRARRAAYDVTALANPLGYHLLHPFVQAVHAAARTYVDLRALRFGQNDARGDGRAAAVDKRADVRVGFIYENARRYVTELPGSPEAKAGARLLRRYFPRGLRAVVGAPFEEELIQIEALLDGLAGADADLPRTLTITHHVTALRDIAAQYGDALTYEDKVTPGELAEAWRAVHTAVVELVCAVIAHVRDPEHRAKILAPIFDQDDRLAAIYARRQRGQSVGEGDLDLDVEAIEQAEREAEAAEDIAEDAADADAMADDLDLDPDPDLDAADAVAQDAAAQPADEGDPPLRPIGLPGRD